MNVCVLGAGSWGTALANILAQNGHRVLLWGRDESVIESINEQHLNIRYLPNATLDPTLLATSDIHSAMDHAQLVLVSTPSTALQQLFANFCDAIPQNALIVHAVKGFVRPDNVRVSEFIASKLPNSRERVVVLSGPSHAEEVVLGMPTTVVVASESQAAAEQAQDAFMNERFRVYTQADVLGVELGGTLKNIIALGVGLVDGLGLGDNTKAALMTRGLAEMTRLGLALGASPLTFSGLAGVGDLIVTCTSSHSRNYRAGKLLASGLSLENVLSQIGMAVEGIGTTLAAFELAQAHQVVMPITFALRRVLLGHLAPVEAVRHLMEREKSHEMEDVGQQPLAMGWKSP